MNKSPASRSVGQRLLRWHKRHGRHDLPWQNTRDPYHIWLAEIMLQQTQVSTVIPYYRRFLKRFPALTALARAPQDTVLKHWAGLGYYARARNLQRAAQIIVQQHQAQFPQQFEQLLALPGIGRSTAGAILAFAFAQRHAIVDGNVKRVLCRYHALRGNAADKNVESRLWQYAEQHTPHKNIAAYTQAMMDLGATVCTRSQPRCQQCPLAGDCRAHLTAQTHLFPTPRVRTSLPVRRARVLLIRNPRGDLLLLRRPNRGIWGGLWSLPQIDDHHPLAGDARAWCAQELQLPVRAGKSLPELRHSFTHFHLRLLPQHYALSTTMTTMPTAHARWVNARGDLPVGVPAPVKKLLADLSSSESYL